MIEDKFEIVKVTLSDLKVLRDISIKTFSETFSSNNNSQDMELYLQINFSESTLSSELNSIYSEFYFLKLDDSIIGYLKLNFGKAQKEIQTDYSIEIERIYVSQEFHNRKLGEELLHTAIRIANSRHCDFIWLAVWEHNLKAIRFYKKHGFIEFDKHNFQLGSESQTDIMMKRMLK